MLDHTEWEIITFESRRPGCGRHTHQDDLVAVSAERQVDANPSNSDL